MPVRRSCQDDGVDDSRVSAPRNRTRGFCGLPLKFTDDAHVCCSAEQNKGILGILTHRNRPVASEPLDRHALLLPYLAAR